MYIANKTPIRLKETLFNKMTKFAMIGGGEGGRDQKWFLELPKAEARQLENVLYEFASL